LHKGDFKTVTELESYFKRMIQNARDYNARGSEVFEDAERLRKALSNLMREHNPAYKLIPNYVAIPTPLPGDEDEESNADEGEEEEEEDDDEDEDEELSNDEPTRAARRKPGRPPKNLQAQRSSATPALSDFQYAGVGFDGLTFQKAQEKIVEDLIREKEYEK
jgi:tRNA(Glu) U13 pseudouridine synthase TruD